MSRKQHSSPLELEQQPVSTLLIKYSLPAIIAMIASSIYNMVDSIFIGNDVGALAISGLAVASPLMNLSVAFGAMVGVGGATVLSVKLGQHNYRDAMLCLGNEVTLNIILGALFGGVALLFLDPILMLFGASESTLPYAREYMQIILLGNIITHVYFGLNGVLRAVGHPRQSMMATFIAVVLNTIMDYVFIRHFGWGIKGAAVATVLAQTIALCWQLFKLSRKDEFVRFRRGIYRPDLRLVREMLAVGVSPMLMNSCACLVNIFINNAMFTYGGVQGDGLGDIAVGAYGINNRIIFMFFMVVMGVCQGMQPIAGYNYGARKPDRVWLVFKYACMAGTMVMSVNFFLGLFLPEEMMRIFTSDPQLIDMAAHGMRINVVFFLVIGFQMVTTNFFQSIGHAKTAIFLSLTRQMLYLLPLVLVLPHFFAQPLDGVWWALPGSDFLAIITALWMIYKKRSIFKVKTQEAA